MDYLSYSNLKPSIVIFLSHIKFASSAQTRVLVTHGISFLPQVDKIIVLVDGQVSEAGSFRELMTLNGAFAEFLRNYLNEELTEEKAGALGEADSK